LVLEIYFIYKNFLAISVMSFVEIHNMAMTGMVENISIS